MPGTMRGLIAAALVALLLPATAHAHRLKAECHVLPGHRIQVEGWYDTGQAAEGAAVEVLRADRSVLTEGKLDAQGAFVFSFDQAEPLKVVVNDGQGHKVDLTLGETLLASPGGPELRANRQPESPFRDILIGVGFLLAAAAFFMSLRNAHQLRLLQGRAGLTESAETPPTAEPPTAPGPR